MIPSGEQLLDIVAAIIPGARRRTRVLAGDDAKFRERRIAGETLVGKYVVGGRMVDGQQAHLIEIDGFFHRFHESETEQAIPRPHAAR